MKVRVHCTKKREGAEDIKNAPRLVGITRVVHHEVFPVPRSGRNEDSGARKAGQKTLDTDTKGLAQRNGLMQGCDVALLLLLYGQRPAAIVTTHGLLMTLPPSGRAGRPA